MKTKLNPTLAGTFVLGALALMVTALLTLHSCNIFSKTGRFVAYFNESVQGLSVGSAVKLRGVQVGRVLRWQHVAQRLDGAPQRFPVDAATSHRHGGDATPR